VVTLLLYRYKEQKWSEAAAETIVSDTFGYVVDTWYNSEII
jgi:hypothetical protein